MHDQSPPIPPKKVNIIGTGVSAVTMQQAVDYLAACIEARHRIRTVVSPVNVLCEAYLDEDYGRLARSAEMFVPDGKPVVVAARLRGESQTERIYGPDLMLALCERSAQHGWRQYYYGGAEGVPEELATTLEVRFPGLVTAGAYSPPFRDLTPEEDAAIIAQINAAQPDVIWVGLGSPKQDFWVAEHRDRLEAPVMLGVGAAFDFHTGRIPQAPAWMQRFALEWVFRLVQEPRRLWRRYAKYNPLFLGLFFLQITGLRKFED